MSKLTTSARARKASDPAPDTFRWHLLPHDGWGLVEINGTLYRYEQLDYEEADGTPKRLWRLRKDSETEYQLAVNHDGELTCDCPHSVYRPGGAKCKHRRLLPVIAAAADEAIWRIQRRRFEASGAAGVEVPF